MGDGLGVHCLQYWAESNTAHGILTSLISLTADYWDDCLTTTGTWPLGTMLPVMASLTERNSGLCYALTDPVADVVTTRNG